MNALTALPDLTEEHVLANLAQEINEEHAAAESLARKAIEHARRSGEKLLMAKTKVQHGQWLPWLAANCPKVSTRRAQEYMKLSREWPAIEAKCADPAYLTIDGALRLLARDSELEPAGDLFAPPQNVPLHFYMLPEFTLPNPGWVATQRYDQCVSHVCESIQHPGYFHFLIFDGYESVAEYQRRPVCPELIRLCVNQYAIKRVGWVYAKDESMAGWIESTINEWRWHWIKEGYPMPVKDLPRFAR